MADTWIAAAPAEGGGFQVQRMDADAPGTEALCGHDEIGAKARALAPGAPVVACGLPDAPRRKVPATPLPDRIEMSGGVAAVPTLSQDMPAHLTLGAETTIAGALSLNPAFDGVICLPGPVTCWAHVSAEEVVSFQTMATGVMARALEAEFALTDWDEAAFLDSLDSTLSRPERLAEHLGRLRAAPSLARAHGALIGAELAAARPYWLGQQVMVIGPAESARRYTEALRHQGLPPITGKLGEMRLKGLIAAKARLAA